MNVKRAGMRRRVITLFSFTGKIELLAENISRSFFMKNREKEELKVREETEENREKGDPLITQQQQPTPSDYSISC